MTSRHVIAALVRARTEQGLSQAKLARRIGVDSSNLCRWETGTFDVSLSKLDRWAEALGFGLAVADTSDDERLSRENADLRAEVARLRAHITAAATFLAHADERSQP